MKLNLSNRTPEQLLKLLDSVKVSDLPINEKARLIEDIEIKISGRKYTNGQVLRDIEDSQSDLDDFIKSFKSVQKAYYKRLVDNNLNLEIYYKGWINRVDKVA